MELPLATCFRLLTLQNGGETLRVLNPICYHFPALVCISLISFLLSIRTKRDKCCEQKFFAFPK
jgi:hypothetical protein